MKAITTDSTSKFNNKIRKLLFHGPSKAPPQTHYTQTSPPPVLPLLKQPASTLFLKELVGGGIHFVRAPPGGEFQGGLAELKSSTNETALYEIAIDTREVWLNMNWFLCFHINQREL
jgi:hypothetical protein